MDLASGSYMSLQLTKCFLKSFMYYVANPYPIL